MEKLDVSRKLPGPAVMVDEDELREAAEMFGYSAEFREACYEAVREAVRRAGDIGLQGGRVDRLGGGGSEATPAATGRGQTSEVERKTSEVKELADPQPARPQAEKGAQCYECDGSLPADGGLRSAWCFRPRRRRLRARPGALPLHGAGKISRRWGGPTIVARRQPT